MPSYKYKGITQKKKRVSDVMEAPSKKEVYDTLKEQNIYALEIEEVLATQSGTLYRLNCKELAEFSRQIGTMQAAGISIIKAIDIMRDKGVNQKVMKVYDHLYYMINQGNTLSRSMESCDGSFPKLMINMYEAGEMSGRLDDTAVKMANYYESENKINSKIKGAMAYPTVLLIVMVAVILILFTFVMPIFFEMYESSGTELNILTRFLQFLSNWIIQNWFILLVVTAFVVIIGRQILRIPAVIMSLDTQKLNLPVFGPLLSIIYTARFSRTLSSLYSSGIPMIDAVEVSAKTIGNRYLESQFEAVAERIRAGQPLSYSMEEVVGIEPKLNAAIFIGEESGRLDSMLLSVSEQYEFESDAAIDRLLTYLEPAMIVIMGLVIGPVLVAVMLPMFNMYSLI